MAAVVNVGGDLVSVSQFYAAMYWGFIVSTSFVGISLVQGYLYFTRNNKDRFTMKATVVSLLILDPTNSLLVADTIYYYFVVNFGVVEVFAKIPIPWTIENELSVLVTAIVQVFFASRVYLVNNTVDALPYGRAAPTLVLLFALVAFVAGTLRTTFIGVWEIPSSSRSMFQIFMIVEESSALVSDCLASACLCYMLTPPHLGSMKRSETLKALFMFTINRAILMSIVQVGLLVAYLSAKNFLYWMPFHLCKGKLYTNTLLAMLNSRSGGNLHSQSVSQPPWSLPVINLTAKENGGIVESSVSTSDRDLEKASPSNENVGPESSLPDPTGPGLS